MVPVPPASDPSGTFIRPIIKNGVCKSRPAPFPPPPPAPRRSFKEAFNKVVKLDLLIHVFAWDAFVFGFFLINSKPISN